MPGPRHRTKNLELQCLRGYAILLTVIAHLGPLIIEGIPYLGFFWLGGGVDLFFCISGFVIAQGLLEKPRTEFKTFYAPFITRRIFRLWPAAIFWSIVVVGLSWLFNRAGSFDTLQNNISTAVAAWLQIVNFKMVYCLNDQIAHCAIASPIRIYWSLSLEEQFYFVFPLVLFVFGARTTAALVALGAMMQLFVERVFPSAWWFFRTDAICLGVLIAWLHHDGIARSFEPKSLAAPKVRLAISLILCVCLFAVARKEIASFYNGLVVIVAAAMVYVASFGKGYFVTDGKTQKVMAYIGERSYSMYLTNMLSITATRELCVRMLGKVPHDVAIGVGFSLFALVLMAALSEFSYRFIEEPFREKGRRLAENLAT